ncbi:MAG TPA: DNA primase [Clostridiaceae bacterium]|nr:DNA primase [Clostridiaceae bacterium]
MAFYSEDIIEEVRVSNDIVDVISEYIRLEKKGSNFFGLCPFHREKTPSFSVSPTKQIFNCFGCGKGGNVIQFIMNIENLDFPEAIKLLANRARITLPEDEDRETHKKNILKNKIIKINTEAARFFHNKLKDKTSQKKALLYLKERGIAPGTIVKFGIGYCSDEGDELFKYLSKAGYNEEIIVKSGLAIKSEKGGCYDRFRNRIIFPIFDVRGSVIGFGGRSIDSSGPKYLNSPESIVYNKRKNLYAMNFARTSGEKRVVVVEGYMDVISLHQNGISNAVASLGTALTVDQGRILKKYFEEVIISYDADTAGQAATVRGLDILNEIGCNVRVLLIPEGKDPDEFVNKYGGKAFQNLMEKTLSLVDYKIEILKKQHNTKTTDGKVEFFNSCAELLSKIDNRVERDMYIVKLAEEYNISRESFSQEVYKKIQPRQLIKQRPVNLKAASGNIGGKSVHDEEKIAYYERILLSLLSMDNNAYFAVKDKLENYEFTSENKEVANFAIDRLADNKGLVAAELLNFTDGELAGKFGRVMQEDCNCEDTRKAVLDIINKIELHRLDIRKQEIIKLLNSQMDEGDVEKLNQELKSIMIKTLLLKKGGEGNES